MPKDVSNNVGKTNVLYPPFETWPFAVAQTTAVAPGGNLSPGVELSFDLNLADPFVMGYLRSALKKGRLDLMVSSLHQVSGQFGGEPFPSLATRFNSAFLNPPTTMDLEVTVVRDLDTDEVDTYTLVYPDRADIANQRLSVLAPIGTAILGYRVGDEVSWQVPAGWRRLRVDEVLFQPERNPSVSV